MLAAPPFSPLIFLSLCAALAVSFWVFYILDHRWTVRRYWTYLQDWAREHGYKLLSADDVHIPQVLAHVHPRLCTMLSNESTQILQIETEPATPSATRWNLLTRPVRAHWPATALRPTRAVRSVADLFSLSSFPTMATSERFVIYGADSDAAARLTKSKARALLPPDIGLLLIGGDLILDFSARPFDPIEFGRIIPIADQLAAEVTIM